MGRQTSAPGDTFSFTSSSTTPLSLKAGQKAVVDGYASYYSQNGVLFFIGTCAYVAGAFSTTTINSDFVSFQGRRD